MPAIFQPLKGGTLFERLGFGRGRIIFENGEDMEFSTRDWAKSHLDKAAELGLATDEEVRDLKDSLRQSNVAASYETIRERVSAMARDLPPGFEAGGLSFEPCSQEGCPNPFFHGWMRKGDIAAPVQTFEDGVGLFYSAIESEKVTPDQAVYLLGQMSEMPLDEADRTKRLEVMPEDKKAELARRVAENRRQQIEAIGRTMIADMKLPGGTGVMVINIEIPPELAAMLSGRLLEDPDEDPEHDM